MSDIFISYDSSDREQAKTLAQVLEQQGWSVWWDRKIPPGKSFNKVIEEALGDAKCIVVLWSKESVNSNWVKDEAYEGLRREILVPVLIDDVRIPLGFRQIQAAQLVGWQGKVTDESAGQLIESIEKVVREPAVKRPEQVKEKLQTKNFAGRSRLIWLLPSTIVPFSIGMVFLAFIYMPYSTPEEKTVPSQKEQKTEPSIPKPIFRSAGESNLTESSVKSMLKRYNFYCKEYDWSKAYYNPNGKGFQHNFKEKVINDDKVIVDQASGLTWQQSGSDKYMTYDEAKAYVAQLNRERFAGFNDWRLPTLEEAMSLMEPTQTNSNLFINPVFDKKQRWIWTSDLDSASRAWVVDFTNGSCNTSDLSYSTSVRAVR